MPTRHSKNATTSAFYSYHERKKIKGTRVPLSLSLCLSFFLFLRFSLCLPFSVSLSSVIGCRETLRQFSLFFFFPDQTAVLSLSLSVCPSVSMPPSPHHCVKTRLACRGAMSVISMNNEELFAAESFFFVSKDLPGTDLFFSSS